MSLVLLDAEGFASSNASATSRSESFPVLPQDAMQIDQHIVCLYVIGIQLEHSFRVFWRTRATAYVLSHHGKVHDDADVIESSTVVVLQ